MISHIKKYIKELEEYIKTYKIYENNKDNKDNKDDLFRKRNLSFILHNTLSQSPFYKEKSEKLNNALLDLQQKILFVKEKISNDNSINDLEKNTINKMLDKMIHFIINSFYDNFKEGHLNKIVQYRGKKDLLFYIISLVSVNPNITFEEMMEKLKSNSIYKNVNFKELFSHNIMKTMLSDAKKIHINMQNIKSSGSDAITWDDFYKQDVDVILKNSGLKQDLTDIANMEIKFNEFLQYVRDVVPELYNETNKIFKMAFSSVDLSYSSNYEEEKNRLKQEFLLPLENKIKEITATVKNINSILENVQNTSYNISLVMSDMKYHQDYNNFNSLLKLLTNNLNYINKEVQNKGNEEKINKKIDFMKNKIQEFLEDYILVGIKVPGYNINSSIFLESIKKRINEKINNEEIRKKISNEIENIFNTILSGHEIQSQPPLSGNEIQSQPSRPNGRGLH